MNYQLYVSAEAMAWFKMLPAADHPPLFGGIPVYESRYLPVESHWDACDLTSRQEVKIASGEWVHMMMIPLPEVDPAGYNLIGNIFKSKPYNL